MMDGRTMANYGDKAFRLGFDVVLPVADIITDVIFTVSIYKERGYYHSFFIYSGNCFIPHFLRFY
jgi:hypothetical protein